MRSCHRRLPSERELCEVRDLPGVRSGKEPFLGVRLIREGEQGLGCGELKLGSALQLISLCPKQCQPR